MQSFVAETMVGKAVKGLEVEAAEAMMEGEEEVAPYAVGLAVDDFVGAVCLVLGVVLVLVFVHVVAVAVNMKTTVETDFAVVVVVVAGTVAPVVLNHARILSSVQANAMMFVTLLVSMQLNPNVALSRDIAAMFEHLGLHIQAAYV